MQSYSGHNLCVTAQSFSGGIPHVAAIEHIPVDETVQCHPVNNNNKKKTTKNALAETIQQLLCAHQSK